jgi:hypothetical protein
MYHEKTKFLLSETNKSQRHPRNKELNQNPLDMFSSRENRKIIKD